MSQEPSAVKINQLDGARRGAWAKYRAVVYGDLSLGRVLLAETLVLLVGNLPGVLGLALRAKLYRLIFPHLGRKVIFGRGVTFRHPRKIRLGDGVVIDDGAVIDAKGDTNRGLSIGAGAYIGRHSIVYCKNGDITLGPRVNISSNCQIFSSNSVTIGEGTMIGAYSYFLSGGEYDYTDPTPFADQCGMCTKGPLIVGRDCWFGARVTVLDGACIGDGCVLAAGAVVTKPLPSGVLAVGVPARVLKNIPRGAPPPPPDAAAAP